MLKLESSFYTKFFPIPINKIETLFSFSSVTNLNVLPFIITPFISLITAYYFVDFESDDK